MPLYAQQMRPRLGFGDLKTMESMGSGQAQRPGLGGLPTDSSSVRQVGGLEQDAARLEGSILHRAQYPRGSVTNARGQTMGVQDALGLLERPRVQFNGATIGSDWGNKPANDFGNPMSRVRQVFEPGLTNQERQRRMQRFEGYDQGAAVREGLLGQERVRGGAAVDAARATAQGQVDAEKIRGVSSMGVEGLRGRSAVDVARETSQGGVQQARIKGQSDVASALAGQADTNRDGVIDPKERLALAEKWAKLDQARLMDPLDGSQAPQQRPALPGEEAFAKMIQDELAKGQVRENPTNVDGFDSAGAFPDMNAQPPRGRVIQLPKENAATGSGGGTQQADPNVRTFQGKTWRFMGGDRRDQRNWRAE